MASCRDTFLETIRLFHIEASCAVRNERESAVDLGGGLRQRPLMNDHRGRELTLGEQVNLLRRLDEDPASTLAESRPTLTPSSGVTPSMDAAMKR
jgi:hypothetical protein